MHYVIRSTNFQINFDIIGKLSGYYTIMLKQSGNAIDVYQKQNRSNTTPLQYTT